MLIEDAPPEIQRLFGDGDYHGLVIALQPYRGRYLLVGGYCIRLVKRSARDDNHIEMNIRWSLLGGKR